MRPLEHRRSEAARDRPKHIGWTREPDDLASTPPAGAVRGVPDVLGLQRLAGNLATRSLLRAGAAASRATAPAGAVVLQRAPAFGLATAQATSEFAKTAVRWRRKYPKTQLADFAMIMVEEASRSLEKVGVPAVDLDRAKPSGAAVFDSASWTIGVNIEATGFAASAKVEDMPLKDLADFAGTFFHEVRHAEQRFLLARLAVGRAPGKDAKAIAADVSMTERIAAAAIKAGGGLSGGQKALAERLDEFRDHHLGYKMWNTRVLEPAWVLVRALPEPSVSPSGVDAITTTWNALAPKVEPLRNQVSWADTRIASLAQQARRSAVDEQVLRDIRATRNALQALLDRAADLSKIVTEWPATKAATPNMTVDDARRVQSRFHMSWLEFDLAVRNLHSATNGAYERYPEEVDSRIVGNAVEAATLRAGGGGAP